MAGLVERGAQSRAHSATARQDRAATPSPFRPVQAFHSFRTRYAPVMVREGLFRQPKPANRGDSLVCLEAQSSDCAAFSFR